MKQAVAILAVLAVLGLALPAPARADASTDAALALGAFAVFNQLLRGETIFHGVVAPRAVVRETVVVHQPPAVVYAPPPAVVYAPPPVVVYPPPPVVYAPASAAVIYYGHVVAPPHHGWTPPGPARKVFWRHWQ
jgi:hypothetical protein